MMAKTLIKLLAVLAAMVAATSTAGACFIFGYQPKAPKSLLR